LIVEIAKAISCLDRLDDLHRLTKDQQPTAEPVTPQGSGMIIHAELGDDCSRSGV
jgi:hypothetical protein